MPPTDLYHLDTPALWVDLDLMEHNIRTLAAYFKQAGVNWRPHTKAMKIPALAHKLIAAGAIGITCAKLGEAEVMAAGGIDDILVANQVVGELKVARLVNLRRQADVMVAVDSLENARQISAAALEAGVRVRVLVELNTGMDRCGLEPGPGVVAFARQVAALPGLELSGLMAWEGHTLHIKNPQEKEAAIRQAVGGLVHTAELCRQAGINIPIVSCGGSGTFSIAANIPGVTEIQGGGAAFTDMTYISYGVDLPPALFVLATVVSRPTPTRAVVDAGHKAMSDQKEPPKPLLEGARLAALNAEHGILELDGPQVALKVGDKINFVVGYSDYTVFLHDRLVGVRRGQVEVEWDILGRGKLT